MEEGKRGRGEEWGWKKSPFFLLPDIRYIRYIRYRIRCRTSFLRTSVISVISVTESVAELPSSKHPLYPLHPLQNPLPNFLLPDIRYIRYRIRCRTSCLIKLKPQSAIAKPKPKLQPNCKQPQSSPLRY